MSDLSMKPSADDLTHRQQAIKGKSAKVSIGKQPENSRPLVFKGFLLMLAACVVLVVAGGGWFVWQQLVDMQQRLDAYSQVIGASGEMLNNLESAVSSQHQSLTNEGGKRSKELKAINSEIRKLWDLSNKRNKANIKVNKNDIAALTRVIDNYKKQFTLMSGSIKESSTVVNSIEQRLVKNTSAHDVLADNVAQLEVAMDELEHQNQRVKKQVSEQNQRLGTIKVDGLAKRLTDVEESIAAIDAHRQQLNGRLDQLNKEIQAIYPVK